MWRCAASLELLPAGTRTDLGNTLVKRMRNRDAGASEFWCLARLGARKLFYAPVNHVLPAALAGRWVESIAKVEGAGECMARLAQVTGDVARDLPPSTVELVRRTAEGQPEWLAILDGDSAVDLDSLGRVFGEELPSGLVLGHE
jgi:hypothetical protein